MGKKDDEDLIKELIEEATKESANIIIPRLRLINGQLRGSIDRKTREYNYNILNDFISQVFQEGLSKGYQIHESELLIKSQSNEKE